MERFHGLYRDINLRHLKDALATEIDENDKSIQKAKSRFGRTEFIVEQNLYDVLTGDYQVKAFLEGMAKHAFDTLVPEEAKKVIENLNRQAKEMFGESYEIGKAEEPHELEKNALKIDFALLKAIHEGDRPHSRDLIAMLSGTYTERNNLAEYFATIKSLLSQFQESMLSDQYCFETLGIAPISDIGIIKKAYRKIAHQTHPDVTLHLSSIEQLALAQRFMKAHEAYRQLESRISTKSIEPNSPLYYLGRLSSLLERESIKT